MALVHVLDEHTINKIAAGEVVERPASVIKELVENAIDAGATSITVEIEDGGTTYMRVIDNGSGMEEEDAQLAILRHATSKIEQVEDLYAIASLGFRGEALASISAVSEFTLTTRRAHNELGTRLVVKGGQLETCAPYGCSVGTAIEVKNLFFNTPVRKKFLKTTRTEGSRIQDIVGKIALSHPSIACKLIMDGRVAIVTPGSDSLEDTVAALYGFKVAKDIFPVTYEAQDIYIEGVVGKPSLLKSSRIWQTLIVNNRVITDKVILKAIDTAYHAMLPKGGYPLVVLRIIVPAETIDINVHPRKNEVKFSDEKALFSAVYRAVLQALEHPQSKGEVIATTVTVGPRLVDKVLPKATQESDISMIRNETRDLQASPAKPLAESPMSFIDDSSPLPKVEVPWVPPQEDRLKTKALYEDVKQGTYAFPKETKYEQTPLTFGPEVQEGHRSYTEEDRDRFRKAYEGRTAIPLVEEEEFIPLGQVAACYILAKKGDDLYIIDQHAAHERVRYDALCNSTEAIPSQTLLLPLYLPAGEEEMVLVEERAQELEDLGFAIELGGPTQLKVTAMPADLLPAKLEEMLRYVFSLFNEGALPTRAQLRHEMLAYASCRGAIKAGHTLNLQQIGKLLQELFHTETPYVCPHGRPTIIRFTPDELGKLFLRV